MTDLAHSCSSDPASFLASKVWTRWGGRLGRGGTGALGPYTDEPREYLRFVEFEGRSVAKCIDEGEVSREARRGHGSIAVYGLNRYGSVKDRSRYLMRTMTSLRQSKLHSAQLREQLAVGAATDITEQTIANELDLLDTF